MSGLFIIGCGTDIGKTVATAAFLLSAKNLGINATVFKPVQTGCSATISQSGESRLDPPDLSFVANICCKSKEEADIIKNNYSYAFLPACSPHLASSMSNKGSITVDKIYKDIKEAEKRYDLVIIEGAGGLMVPLNENETFRDLAQMLGYEAIVVTDNKLGCINEALLTIEALNSKELSPLGIVMNNTSSPNEMDLYIKKDNPLIIEGYSGVPVITEIPYTDDLSRENTGFWSTITENLEVTINHVSAIKRS